MAKIGHVLTQMNNFKGNWQLQSEKRPEAKAVIDKLRQCQIKSMYILSGDQEMPTQKLAQDLGIDHYFAQVLPQNKAEIIEHLQKKWKNSLLHW